MKQLVRDVIQPERDLGHSDRKVGYKKGEERTENVMSVEGKVGGEDGTGEVVTSASEEKISGGGDVTSQVRKDEGSTCEDCQ